MRLLVDFLRSLFGPAPPEYDPTAHHRILAYLRHIESGAASDAAFENRRLSTDLGFNTLNMAEVLLAVVNERGLSIEAVLGFMRVSPPHGEARLANLLERTTLLAEDFDERDRMLMLSSGAVGDPSEIVFLSGECDHVRFVVRYCDAIEKAGRTAPEQWAPRAGKADPVADAFEERLLDWLKHELGIACAEGQGPNSRYWRFYHEGSLVELVVIGQRKNTCKPPSPGIDWLLRIQQQEPLTFAPLIERFFTRVPRTRRTMDKGVIQVQFKSTELLPDSPLGSASGS